MGYVSGHHLGWCDFWVKAGLLSWLIIYFWVLHQYQNPSASSEPDLSWDRDDKIKSPGNTKTRFHPSSRWQKRESLGQRWGRSLLRSRWQRKIPWQYENQISAEFEMKKRESLIQRWGRSLLRSRLQRGIPWQYENQISAEFEMTIGNPSASAEPDLSLGRDDKRKYPGYAKTRFQPSLRWKKGIPYPTLSQISP